MIDQVGTALLGAAASGTRHVRFFVDRWTRRMELRLHAWRLRMDPETAEWVRSARALAADREAVAKLLTQQPNPRDLIEQYRRTLPPNDGSRSA
jgi:hypothetical protein